MAFSFSKAPVKKKAPRLHRKPRGKKPAVIRAAARLQPAPTTKAAVIKLIAMIIDPDVEMLTDEAEIILRKKLRLRKALQCVETYDHFLGTPSTPKVTKMMILRRGRKPLFRTV